MSNNYDEENYPNDQSFYEEGLEGEYQGDPPPGYESWAEWHYEHGDELPTDEDYGIFPEDEDDDDEDEDEDEDDDDEDDEDVEDEYVEDEYVEDEYVEDDFPDDCYYDDKTDYYYSPSTRRYYTQQQLDARDARETAYINALAERIEAEKRILQQYKQKLQQRQNRFSYVPIRRAKCIKQRAAEMGVHPSMFTRTDQCCWQWIQDVNTWFYKHPRLLNGLKYGYWIFVVIVIIIELIVFYKLNVTWNT